MKQNKPKKIVDQSNVLNQEQVEKEKAAGKRRGIAQKPITEAVPKFESAETEHVIQGDNNSFVILGRDRPGNLMSGYGGKGATQAGRIDLIVGLDAANGPRGADKIANPNFALDAARVYISQKADIDRYMGLAEVPGQAPPGRSTIGLKADTVRIHARNDIKIVTGRARIEGAKEKLSTGGLNETPGTISLIAGNYTDEEKMSGFSLLNPLRKLRGVKRKLQPIPKGDNLADCLTEIIEAIQQLSSMVGDNTSLIMKMDSLLSVHTHMVGPAPFPPFPPIALPSAIAAQTIAPVTTGVAKITLERQILNKNLGLLKLNYLNENFGSVYINSKHVFTT